MDDNIEESGKTETAAPKVNVHELLNHALQFLSHASNETLVACFAGLGVITHLALGRVGLVLIGTVVGVALHATWEGNVGPAGGMQAGALDIKRRRELGLDVMHRVLDWRETKQDHEDKNHRRGYVQDVDVLLAAHEELEFADFQPATGAALTSLVNAVVRDYVKYGLTLHR